MVTVFLGIGSAWADRAQLGAEVERLEIPDGNGHVLRVQWSRDSSLILTPNESHFPKLGLKAEGSGIVPSIPELNGKNSFASITSWDPGDVAAWGIWLERAGKADIRIAGEGDAKFRLQIESKTYEFSPTPAGKYVTLAHQFTRPGQHLIRIENSAAVGNRTKLGQLELSGEAMQGAGVLRTRWRPAAAHARFSSSGLKTGAMMWIMEMDAMPGELGFYAPITTPFGYYGPSWDADGTVKASMNFSLWSYSRNAPEPAIEKLSHLLAIGSPDASFGGFGHEGTGVKIRNFDPLEGRQGQGQAFALRVEPGKPYDTYFSYYYATDEKRWRLFGVGRKLASKRPLKHLSPGTFVEVPGPPQVQRSGPAPRRMRYRGWISADGKQWRQLNQMTNGNIDKKTGLTHTQRGSQQDWFFLQTGGWILRRPESGNIQLESPTAVPPEFLQADRIADILEVPSSIAVRSAIRKGDEITINYEIKTLGKSPRLFLYHGSGEGLTLEKKWTHRIELPGPASSTGSATIKVAGAEPVYLRLLLKNEHGQFWTWETTRVG
ncbi:MAG: hypothetical protein ACI8XO_003078 [Verrucomicrobiales bacterium]